jgi:hypothetical protein
LSSGNYAPKSIAIKPVKSEGEKFRRADCSGAGVWQRDAAMMRSQEFNAPFKIVRCENYHGMTTLQIGLNFTRVELAIGRPLYAVAVFVECCHPTVPVLRLVRVKVRERFVSHIDAHETRWLFTVNLHPEPNCFALSGNGVMGWGPYQHV